MEGVYGDGFQTVPLPSSRNSGTGRLMDLRYFRRGSGPGSSIRPAIAFFSIPSFIFGTPTQGSFVPAEIDPVRVKYTYQTRTTGGGTPCPPPRKRPTPPPTTLFVCWSRPPLWPVVSTRKPSSCPHVRPAIADKRAVLGPSAPPTSRTSRSQRQAPPPMGRDVLSRDRRRAQFLHLRPLFAVRLPLTHTCRLLNGRDGQRGPVPFVDSGTSCGPLFLG